MAKKKISEYLAQKALPDCINLETSGGNSSHPDWPVLTAKCLEEWKDFGSMTFEYVYSEVNDLLVDCPMLKKPPKQMTRITGEDSVERLLVAVFQTALGHLLEAVKSKLGREIWLGGTSLCNLGSGVSLSNKSDWHCAIMQGGSYNRSVCYCPGDTKKANMFQPEQLWPEVDSRYEAENMLPIRQAAHYARLARTRYAYIVTEVEFVALRISVEEGRARSPQQRLVPQRTAAPLPGAMRLSGSSDISTAFSAMSLDSFAPEDPIRVEMATFPWNKEHKGLTGFAAWFWLLVISTEDEKHGTGRYLNSSYLPLHAMTLKTEDVKRDKHNKRDKRGKKTQSVKSSYTSLLNGVTYHHKPAFAKVIEDSHASSEGNDLLDEQSEEDYDKD